MLNAMLLDVTTKPILLTSAALDRRAYTLAFVDKSVAAATPLHKDRASHADLIAKVIDGKAPARNRKNLPWLEVEEERLPQEAVFCLNDIMVSARSRPSPFGPAQVIFTPSKDNAAEWAAALHYQHHGTPTDETVEGIDARDLLPHGIRAHARKAYINYARVTNRADGRHVHELRLVIDDGGRRNRFLMTHGVKGWSCNDKPELQTAQSMIFDPSVATPDQLVDVCASASALILQAAERHLPAAAARTLPVTWQH